jgi:hypothetical protein
MAVKLGPDKSYLRVCESDAALVQLYLHRLHLLLSLTHASICQYTLPHGVFIFRSRIPQVGSTCDPAHFFSYLPGPSYMRHGSFGVHPLDGMSPTVILSYRNKLVTMPTIFFQSLPPFISHFVFPTRCIYHFLYLPAIVPVPHILNDVGSAPF